VINSATRLYTHPWFPWPASAGPKGEKDSKESREGSKRRVCVLCVDIVPGEAEMSECWFIASHLGWGLSFVGPTREYHYSEQ